MATRTSWIVGESTNMGECIEKDGTIRQSLEIDGLAPPGKWTIKGTSSGSIACTYRDLALKKVHLNVLILGGSERLLRYLPFKSNIHL